MCQDETRLGLKTIAGRLITACGIKPVGFSQWQRENFYLYGVVEPLTGYSFFYEFSHLDGNCFQKFLEMLSAELGEDVAVIQFDQGSFHKIKTREKSRKYYPDFSTTPFSSDVLGGSFPPKARARTKPNRAVLGIPEKQTAMGKLQNPYPIASKVS